MKAYKPFFLFSLCAMCLFSGGVCSASVPENGYQCFTNLFSMVDDVLDDNLMTGKLHGQRCIAAIQSMIDENGWTTGQVVDALSFIVTNGIPERRNKWNGRPGAKVIFDRALGALSVFGSTNAIPVIESVLDTHNPLVTGRAYNKYAGILGFGHDAFNRYTDMLSSPHTVDASEAWMAYNAICAEFDKNPRSSSETNRLVALLFEVHRKYRYEWADWEFDVNLCNYWAGYSSSSNRLEFAIMSSNDVPEGVSHYFAMACAELLSLPPGTMQLLSTNQFYNVED